MFSTTSPKGLNVANGAEARFLPKEEKLICCMSYIQQKVHIHGKITHRLKITVRSKWLIFKTFLKANFDKGGRELTHLPSALLRPGASLFDAWTSLLGKSIPNGKILPKTLPLLTANSCHLPVVYGAHLAARHYPAVTTQDRVMAYATSYVGLSGHDEVVCWGHGRIRKKMKKKQVTKCNKIYSIFWDCSFGHLKFRGRKKKAHFSFSSHYFRVLTYFELSLSDILVPHPRGIIITQFKSVQHMDIIKTQTDFMFLISSKRLKKSNQDTCLCQGLGNAPLNVPLSCVQSLQDSTNSF